MVSSLFLTYINHCVTNIQWLLYWACNDYCWQFCFIKVYVEYNINSEINASLNCHMPTCTFPLATYSYP